MKLVDNETISMKNKRQMFLSEVVSSIPGFNVHYNKPKVVLILQDFNEN